MLMGAMRKTRRKPIRIGKLIRESYDAASLRAIRALLERHGTHDLRPIANGLFAATAKLGEGAVSGYQNAWIRDNIMIANSFRLRGQLEVARGTIQGLTEYFHKHLDRFRKIIANPRLKEDVQQRPHVRFNAMTLGENRENWPHAQNDALGLALWLRFVLANSNGYELAREDWEVYSLFPRYLQAIEFWQDRDSGSWEETRKVNNSSVGAVVAGLEEMRKHLEALRESRAAVPEPVGKDASELIPLLLEKGKERLRKTLPFESPPERMMDGAVLSLIYPLGVLKERQAQDSIVNLARARLQGAAGIRRYLGDSYFCQDYDKWFPPEEQAADFSNAIEYRDALLAPGCEAQWCLFDPVLSIISGQRYIEGGEKSDLAEQTFYFNRSLRQLTPEFECPELYFLSDGKYITNDHTPLAWTQANQALALHFMEKSVSMRRRAKD